MEISADTVLPIVAAEAGLDIDRLAPDKTLEDLDISSLDLAGIVFELEERFGVEIEPEDVSRDWTVAQLIDHVASLKQE